MCIGRRARKKAVIAPKIARVHARCTVIANRADDATRPFFCSVAAAKVGASARSENRQNATQPENSSVAAAGTIVTNIALLPKFVRRSVQGRPRCLQARAPRCTECGLDVYCAIPRRHAPAEGASCRAPPARRCRSSGKWGPKRANQMTQYSKTRVLVGRGGGILEIAAGNNCPRR